VFTQLLLLETRSQPTTSNVTIARTASKSRLRLHIMPCLYNILVMHILDATFAALSDPTRRAILARLARSEATVMQLAEPFEMTQPAISRHLKVLESAGLIVRRVEGTKRPCRLAEGGIDAIDQWLGTLRKALARNYDRLDQLLADTKQPSKGREKR
jgi:DNA-binding transcriptional ArsR family regulator